MRKLAGVLLMLTGLGALYLLAWPVPIEPVAWTPPPAPPLAGPYAPNTALREVERLADGVGHGPEALALDAQQRVYTGYLDGRVMRFDAEGRHGVELANTGGRPLGLKFAPDGRLIVADAVKGLLHVAEGGVVRVLATEAGGQPLGFTDDLAITRDGVVYFSDASTRFGVHEVMEDFFEHGANGRLVRHDLSSGRTEVVADRLHFPNGVALGPDDAWVLVNETANYRVLRYWLKGERAGQLEPFIEALPGFPDNITFDSGRGRFWLALYAPRNPDLDAMAGSPFVRKIVYRLPRAVHPAPVMHGFVLGLDLSGQVVANLQDATNGAYAPITSAIATAQHLYLGSLLAPSFARLPLGEQTHGHGNGHH